MLSYLREPRLWVNKVVATAHNAKAFDLHFIPNRAVLLKWRTELIMNGLKIMCSLRKLPEAFGLTASKSW